jgi:hypothetical protein
LAGHCTAIKPSQWLLLKEHWEVGASAMSATVVASPGTVLKKSELISRELPPNDKRNVSFGTVEHFTTPLVPVDRLYWLADLK